jgi:hypothetical protein
VREQWILELADAPPKVSGDMELECHEHLALQAEHPAGESHRH